MPGVLIIAEIFSWLHMQSFALIPIYFLGGPVLDSLLWFALVWGVYVLLDRPAIGKSCGPRGDN